MSRVPIVLELENPMTAHLVSMEILTGRPVLGKLGLVNAIFNDGLDPQADRNMKILKKRSVAKVTSWWTPFSNIIPFIDLQATHQALHPMFNVPTLNAFFGNRSFLRFAGKHSWGFPVHMSSVYNNSPIVHTFSFCGDYWPYRVESLACKYLWFKHPGKKGVLGITSGNYAGESVTTTLEEGVQLATEMGIRFVIKRNAPTFGASYPILEAIEMLKVHRERGNEGHELVQEISNFLSMPKASV